MNTKKCTTKDKEDSVVFLGGETDPWREDIMEEFKGLLTMIDPVKDDWEASEDIYIELAQLVTADERVFLRGGEGTEREKEFLDKLDLVYNEFEDEGELNEYLNNVVVKDGNHTAPFFDSDEWKDSVKEITNGLTCGKDNEQYDIAQMATDINSQYFDNQIELNFPMRYGNLTQSFGQVHTERIRATGVRTVVDLVMSNNWELGEQLFKEILGHELVHALVAQKYRGKDYGGSHGIHFTDELAKLKAKGLNAPVSEEVPEDLDFVATDLKKPKYAFIKNQEWITVFNTRDEQEITTFLEVYQSQSNYNKLTYTFELVATVNGGIKQYPAARKLNARKGNFYKLFTNDYDKFSADVVQTYTVAPIVADPISEAVDTVVQEPSYLDIPKVASINVTADYEHGCIYAPVPEELSRICLKEIAPKIDPKDLYSQEETLNGIETETHCTVLYGIDPTPQNIETIKKHFTQPIKMRSDNKVTYFDNDNSVVKIAVFSEDLTKLHTVLKEELENKDTHPEYQPHITIAYVQPGYRLDDDKVEPMEWEITKLILSNPDGSTQDIYLEEFEPIKEAVEVIGSVLKSADAVLEAPTIEGVEDAEEFITEYIQDVSNSETYINTSSIGHLYNFIPELPIEVVKPILLDTIHEDSYSNALEGAAHFISEYELANIDNKEDLINYGDILIEQILEGYLDKVTFPDDVHNAEQFDIWRAVTIEDVPEYLKFLKGELTEFNNNNAKYNTVGVYWAHNKAASDVHWGQQGELIILHGQVARENIDWAETIRTGMDMDDEDELHINDNAPITVLDITLENEEIIPINKIVKADYAYAPPGKIFDDNRQKFPGNLGDNMDYYDINYYSDFRDSPLTKKRIDDMWNVGYDAETEAHVDESILEKADQADDYGMVEQSNQIPGKGYEDYVTTVINGLAKD